MYMYIYRAKLKPTPVKFLGHFVPPRVVKMGWNPRANPTHHRFRSGWVEIFLQISIRVDF